MKDTHHQKVFLNTMATLINDTKYSDLTIICEGRAFKVHRTIVCPQAGLIALTLRPGFQESKTLTIDYKQEFRAETVARVISYLYRQDYRFDVDLDQVSSKVGIVAQGGEAEIAAKSADGDEEMTEVSGDSEETSQFVNELVAHLQVLSAAHYFQIGPLKLLASNKFEESLWNGWNVRDFLKVVEKTYSFAKEEGTLPRVYVLKSVVQHFGELKKSNVLPLSNDIREDVKFQEFIADLCDALVKEKDMAMKKEEELESKIRELESRVTEECLKNFEYKIKEDKEKAVGKKK